MATLLNDHPTGTFGTVTVYNFLGKLRIRKKSSLTGNRVKKSKAFKPTMKHANDLGKASKIGSVIYQALPLDIRELWLFQAITGDAASLLYKGNDEQEVKDLLWKKYITNTHCENEAAGKIGCTNFAHSTRENNIQLREVFLERWEKQGLPYYYFKRAWQKRGYFNRERFREVLDVMEAPWNKKNE